MGAFCSHLANPFSSDEDADTLLTKPYPCDYSCKDTLASCASITKRMQAVLERDGLHMLHRSKWRCLASSYSVEIKGLINSMTPRDELDTFILHKLAGPLQALEQAVKEGEACMYDYIIPKGNRHSWLVDKALKLAMSTDVVDVHLHHFLWVSSTVYLYLHRFLDGDFRHRRFLDRTHQFMEGSAFLRAQELCKIWKKVDAKDDMHIAQDLLINLRGKCAETNQLVDFILYKLSHVEDPHDHVTLDSLPPNYMCIDSNQCRPTNTECLFKTDVIEIRKVLWLGRLFVLKSFKRMDFNLTERQNFKREAAIQARVCHSNLLSLVCCTRKPAGLLMELMKEDLHTLIRNLGKNPPFPLLMAVDLMLQIAKGMECLHTLGIVHRDLKSRNILVSFPRLGDSNHASSVNSQVHLKIADFGVSKAKHDCSEYSTRDQGTTSWMAPEVYGAEGESNEPTRYSNKADVYSFAMVCFEILTGNLPFEGGRVRMRVAKGERPRLPRHCPTALSSLIQMCWAAEPRRRPNFSQICGILRYFKACIFLQDCHVDWQSSPLLSLDFSIDDRYLDHSSEFPDRAAEKIRPLRIPLEMHYFGAAVHRLKM